MIDLILLHLCSTLRIRPLSPSTCSTPLAHPTYRGGGGADGGRSVCCTCSTFAPPQSIKVEQHFDAGFRPGRGFNITNLKGMES